jgi:phage terminase large subunit-like protein
MAEAGLRARFEPVTGDKETRAGPFASAAEGGRVRLVRGAWNGPFLDEYAAFPMGTLKDMVDSGSSAFSKVSAARKQKEVSSYEG